MHVKLTYQIDGFIDVEVSAQSMRGDKVSRLLDLLGKFEKTSLVVERLSPSGSPLQEPEILK